MTHLADALPCSQRWGYDIKGMLDTRTISGSL